MSISIEALWQTWLTSLAAGMVALVGILCGFALAAYVSVLCGGLIKEMSLCRAKQRETSSAYLLNPKIE